MGVRYEVAAGETLSIVGPCRVDVVGGQNPPTGLAENPDLPPQVMEPGPGAAEPEAPAKAQ